MLPTDATTAELEARAYRAQSGKKRKALPALPSGSQDLRRIEEISERYEYIPAQMKVIEDACFTYACACMMKTATKPSQPIEKSTAGASLLAQVIVAKYADHLPLHRQTKMFARHGVELSDQTLCGWTAQCAQLLEPLYQRLKRFVLASKVVGTAHTPVKVLDRKLPQARKGRIWPDVGDRDHVAAVYDYTATRERAEVESPARRYLEPRKRAASPEPVVALDLT